MLPFLSSLSWPSSLTHPPTSCVPTLVPALEARSLMFPHFFLFLCTHSLYCSGSLILMLFVGALFLSHFFSCAGSHDPCQYLSLVISLSITLSFSHTLPFSWVSFLMLELFLTYFVAHVLSCMYSCLRVPTPFILPNVSCPFTPALSHACFICHSLSLAWTCSFSHAHSFLYSHNLWCPLLLMTSLSFSLPFLHLSHACMCFLTPLSCDFALFLVTLFSLFITRLLYCTCFLFLLPCLSLLHILIHMLSFPFSFSFSLSSPSPSLLPSLVLLSLLLSLFQLSFLSHTCSLFLTCWCTCSMSHALAVCTASCPFLSPCGLSHVHMLGFLHELFLVLFHFFCAISIFFPHMISLSSLLEHFLSWKLSLSPLLSSSFFFLLLISTHNHSFLCSFSCPHPISCNLVPFLVTLLLCFLMTLHAISHATSLLMQSFLSKLFWFICHLSPFLEYSLSHSVFIFVFPSYAHPLMPAPFLTSSRSYLQPHALSHNTVPFLATSCPFSQSHTLTTSQPFLQSHIQSFSQPHACFLRHTIFLVPFLS